MFNFKALGVESISVLVYPQNNDNIIKSVTVLNKSGVADMSEWGGRPGGMREVVIGSEKVEARGEEEIANKTGRMKK